MSFWSLKKAFFLVLKIKESHQEWMTWTCLTKLSFLSELCFQEWGVLLTLVKFGLQLFRVAEFTCTLPLASNSNDFSCMKCASPWSLANSLSCDETMSVKCTRDFELVSVYTVMSRVRAGLTKTTCGALACHISLFLSSLTLTKLNFLPVNQQQWFEIKFYCQSEIPGLMNSDTRSFTLCAAYYSNEL